ncbi:hypothetical protein DBV15_07761 [Temnothorax longispinosus]|uniref:IQ and AAA domain-containing protein 1-like protein n=1 Tax=Temnothorax longispinosus TaxID=300112 RepID=A0A4S2L273_9HYME|nr:hypothetical protein DBV15_07761 [Temnothorax longispinosus]
MSHVYYNELWLITRGDLEKLLELERRLQESTPLKKGAALNSALFIYLRYRNIVRRLIMCYDQMVQTQKRELIKKMLECAIGRMLEYKKEIVKLDYMDYQWPDDILNQMKFTPDDIELFAAASGRERVEERRKFIQELIESAHKVPQTRERSLSQIHIESMSEMEDQTLKTRAARRRMRIMQPSKVELIRESPEEKAAREAKLAAERIMRSAILLIQSHERARKGRCYGADVDDVMRAELDVLNKALLKDHAHDKEKFTIPTMDKNIDKTGTKRKKDILEDVAVEDLFSELLRAKIIRNYPTIFLRDWFGDLSYQNYEARREFRDFKHRLGEVKQLVLEYCILPLISKGTHQVAPLVRSVCIYGLPGAGKTLLANVICSEILFLSLSEEPQKATAGFNKFHDKFIRVPTTDYNTLYMYYKNLLMKYHGVDRDIDVSCLAKMSVGIPLNFIRQAVEKVLSLRRRITLKFNPLSPIEIMNEILTYQYPTTEMVESLDKFEKLTLSARRKTKVS